MAPPPKVLGGDTLTEAALRARIARNMATPGDYLIVNYARATLGQDGGGHISPIAAYDATADRVLILDTARYRYPPTWVPLPLLWEAMRTTDPETGLARGLVEVRASGA
jgi:Phytochelatin synthase.